MQKELAADKRQTTPRKKKSSSKRLLTQPGYAEEIRESGQNTGSVIQHVHGDVGAVDQALQSRKTWKNKILAFRERGGKAILRRQRSGVC